MGSPRTDPDAPDGLASASDTSLGEPQALTVDRTNRRVAVVVFLASICLISVGTSAAILSLHRWDFARFLGDPGDWAMLLVAVVAAWLCIGASRRRTRLVIDQNGLQLTEDGHTRRYRWPDIASVRHVVANPRTGATVVQIVRKGQVLIDDRSDLIWNEFGLSEEQLTAIILAGKARWGTRTEA